MSADGGRTRLRENKRGKKTAKGRRRFRGAWREPKLFIIYVVDAEGKLDRSFVPILDALIQGPELIDFYHAVEHLGKLASLRKGWSSKQRKSWVHKHRNILLQGYV